MKIDIINLILSELYIFNILLLVNFLFIFRYRILYILFIYNIILFIVEIFISILFISILPTGCEPNSWLGKKLKSKILLFNNIKIFSIFILLVKPLGYLIGFNFLFLAPLAPLPLFE